MDRFSSIQLIEYPAVLLAWYPVYGQHQIRYPAFVGYTVKLVSDPSLLIKYFLKCFFNRLLFWKPTPKILYYVHVCRLGRISLGVPYKIFRARLVLSVRISQIHFQTSLALITVSLSFRCRWENTWKHWRTRRRSNKPPRYLQKCCFLYVKYLYLLSPSHAFSLRNYTICNNFIWFWEIYCYEKLCFKPIFISDKDVFLTVSDGAFIYWIYDFLTHIWCVYICKIFCTKKNNARVRSNCSKVCQGMLSVVMRSNHGLTYWFLETGGLFKKWDL